MKRDIVVVLVYMQDPDRGVARVKKECACHQKKWVRRPPRPTDAGVVWLAIRPPARPREFRQRSPRRHRGAPLR
jgi:hypothetical protein